MKGTRSRGLWLVALVAAVVSVPVTAARGAAADEEPMDPNEVWVIDAFVPGTPIEKPEDGRLRGYGFSAQVEGVSEALVVERVFGDYKPAPGQKIVVFALKFDFHGQRDYDRPIRGTVIVDGRRTAIDYSFGSEHGPLVAASVPLDAKSIELELAAAEIAQTLSLTQRKRVGLQPVVLYRDPAGPEVVSDVNADRVVKTSDDRVTASVSMTLKRVRLSWFSPPEPVTTPSSTDRAYLVVEAAAEPRLGEDEGSFEEFGTVPAADLRLRLADGSEVEARHAGPSDDLLSGSYYFEVPADLNTATLFVGPTTVPAKRRLNPLIQPTQVRIERAIFDISLPPGNPPVRSEEPATPTTAAHRTGNDEPSRAAAGRDDKGARWWPALVLLALAAVALAGWRVRRRASGRAQTSNADAPLEEAAGESREPVDLFALSEQGWLNVEGPGALEAVRATVVNAATHFGENGHADVVVLAREETNGLIPVEAAKLPWLSVVGDEESLFAEMEVFDVRRTRLHVEENPDYEVPSPFGATFTGPPLVIVVPGSLDRTWAHRLSMIPNQPQRGRHLVYQKRLLVVGHAVSAPCINVEADGTAVMPAERPARAGCALMMTETEAMSRLAEVAVPSSGDDDPSETDTPQSGPSDALVTAIRVLGPCRIKVADREVASGLRKKGQELLALLAVHRDGVTADAAMEALWPGAEPDPAYFRTVLANLRTVLRAEAGPDEPTPVVERLGQRYRLNPARVDVDLWRFEDALDAAARGDDEAAEAAAAAYRGDLLDGEDWPWADPVRQRLRGRAVDNLSALAERRRAAGDLAAALHAAERAVEHDPYAEELYQRVMTLHRDLGRPDGARRTYEVLEARLADLGVTPNTTSRALGNGAGA